MIENNNLQNLKIIEGLYGKDSGLLLERISALKRFEVLGLPKKNDNLWHYTNLNHLKINEFIKDFNNKQNNQKPSIQDSKSLENFYNIHIKNGEIIAQDQIANLEVLSLAEIFATKNNNTKYQEYILDILKQNNEFNNNSLNSLNTAFNNFALVMFVKAEFINDKPLFISYDNSNIANQTQIFICMEENSTATIFESFTSNNENIYSQFVSRINLKTNAKLIHYNLQNQQLESNYIHNKDINLSAKSSYRLFLLNSGSLLSRNEIYYNLNAKEAKADFSAINLGKLKQHHDIYIKSAHNSAHTNSQQSLKQILTDDARGIFYGNITIAKDCPKSEAHQLSKTMLLSDKSWSLSRPELDILTDDVICSHGSTTGNINKDAIYYLMSRGIDKKTAISYLISAFIDELVGNISDQNIHHLIVENINSWRKLWQ